MARVGILGGTFNPPHIGHLVCAHAACEQLGLDRVTLVPASVPPHKPVPDDPGAQARLEMCELAVAGDSVLGTSDAELRRDGPSYTVDTLRGLRDAAPDDELTLIVGGDMAAAFGTWHDPEGILALARLAVVERHDVDRDEIAARLAAVAGAEGRHAFFDMPRIDISSSLLRDRVRVGRSIRYLVPDGVVALISERGYYCRPANPYPEG